MMGSQSVVNCHINVMVVNSRLLAHKLFRASFYCTVVIEILICTPATCHITLYIIWWFNRWKCRSKAKIKWWKYNVYTPTHRVIKVWDDIRYDTIYSSINIKSHWPNNFTRGFYSKFMGNLVWIKLSLNWYWLLFSGHFLWLKLFFFFWPMAVYTAVVCSASVSVLATSLN